MPVFFLSFVVEFIDFKNFLELTSKATLPSYYNYKYPLEWSMLRCLTSCAGLTALPREKFIFDLILNYIRHDNKARLRQNQLTCDNLVQLFETLKLAHLAKDIDFAALGLEELNDNDTYAPLHQLIQQCTVPDDYDFYSGELPRKYWAPRPQSVSTKI